MRLYILNTTKPYRDDEDEYTGAWFSCPVTFEEIKEKLGVEKEEDFEIEDYELPFSLSPDMPLWEINALCRMVQEIEGTPLGNELSEIQAKWFHNISDFFDHKDDIIQYPCDNMVDIAYHLIDECGVLGEIPDRLRNYIDYEAFARDIDLDGCFIETRYGVFECPY